MITVQKDRLEKNSFLVVLDFKNSGKTYNNIKIKNNVGIISFITFFNYSKNF